MIKIKTLKVIILFSPVTKWEILSGKDFKKLIAIQSQNI